MKKSKLLFVLLCGLLTLTGCNNSSTSPTTSSTEDEYQYVDYVHDSNVKLTYDYKGKDFYKDGIGEMQLKMVIDGDTAHFYPVVTTTSDEPVKSRYYGIDTPESTGKIQPYGHAASEFNKEKLLNASTNGTIVVSTPNGLTNEQIANGANPYVLPSPDSTGSRYVSLVWINETKKNANYDELILLNLWIVQGGYSWVKAVGDIPEYAPTFYQAEQQAKDLKLVLFSGVDDPDMPTGDYVLANLLEMKVEMERLIKEPESEYAYNNQKLRIRGTVAGFANNTLYLSTYYTPEECAQLGRNKPNGEWAGINIYCGAAAIADRFKVRNAVIELCGIMSYSENFGVQLSGVNFPNTTLKNKDTDARVIITAENNTEEYRLEVGTYSKEELNNFVKNTDLECFNSAIQLGTLDQEDNYVAQQIKCTDFYSASGSNTITLSFEGCNFDVYLPFAYKPYVSVGGDDTMTIWKTRNDFVGKTFTIRGVFAIHQSKSSSGRYYFDYQIVPSAITDFVCVDLL